MDATWEKSFWKGEEETWAQELATIENVEVYHEDITVFTMHDLVHDLARSVMIDRVLDVGKQGNTGGNRSLSVLLSDSNKSLKSFTQDPSKISAMRAVQCEKIVLYGASTSFPEYLPFLLCGQIGIHEDVFSFAKYLRVLDIRQYSKQELPKSIGDLKQLRYLSVSRVQHQTTANYITKLSKLIYLSLRWSSNIVALSESIGEMEGLMYLDLHCCSSIEKLPLSFGKLKELVHLDLSKCSKVTNISLEGLTKLEYLNLSYCSIIGVPGMLEVFGSLTKLQYLNLSGLACYFGDNNVHLEKTSKAMGNLTELGYLNWRAGEALDTFLKCISKLPNLEHLDLSCNNTLMTVPHCLGNLCKLHTLNLSGCRELKILPANLYDMGSLRFLDLTGCLNLRMPKQHRLNKSLLTLPHFLVQADCHDSSSNLHLLQEVNHRDLVISRLENVKSAQEVRSINLKGKSKMTELELNWTKDVERFVEDIEVLGELVPPTSLQVLKIDGYNSARFPEWFVGSIALCNSLPSLGQLPNLAILSISNFPKCKSLPPLRQLPALRSLVLEQMNGISEIHWPLQCDCGQTQAFPCLESLTLRQMESLKVWYTECPNCGHWGPRTLSYLKISDCPNLRLKPCPPGAWYLRRIHGRNDGVISSWEEGASQASVSSSSVLVTTLIVNLYGVCSLHHVHDLTSLTINDCISLSISSPVIIKALSSLRTVHLRELTKWLDHLASLEHLTVRCQEVGTCVEPQFGFPHLTQLRSLCLSEFKSMTSLQEWVGDLVSLQRLEILSCQNLNDLSLSIGRLRSLKELKIRMCDSITSLPDSIGCLTSLTRLHIGHCGGITCLPESIRQLTKLKRLDILECKELEKWCETEENKAKLAHIKEKTINDWSQSF